MDYLYSSIMFLIAIALSLKILSDYRKGEYIPFPTRKENPVSTKVFFIRLSFLIPYNFSIMSISNKSLLKFTLITNMIIVLSVTNILNYKCASIQPEKNVIRKTMGLNIFIIAFIIFVLIT